MIRLPPESGYLFINSCCLLNGKASWGIVAFPQFRLKVSVASDSLLYRRQVLFSYIEFRRPPPPPTPTPVPSRKTALTTSEEAPRLCWLICVLWDLNDIVWPLDSALLCETAGLFFLLYSPALFMNFYSRNALAPGAVMRPSPMELLRLLLDTLQVSLFLFE